MTDLHVCFVCSGNICRSPMAAIVFRHHLRDAGLTDRVRVTSAGTGPWHVGETIDHRAGATLAAHGYHGEHIAAQIDGDHLDADLLLAADTGHLRTLRRKVDDPERVRLLREFDPTACTAGSGGLPPAGVWGADPQKAAILRFLIRTTVVRKASKKSLA